ncbi:MAG: VWA domain-containing protein [Myxococcaceae bacterium]|jgi:Mg-chelatase subunit ChlD|nr:VWA domain-containing protein [Myxococcaceae bacterium]
MPLPLRAVRSLCLASSLLVASLALAGQPDAPPSPRRPKLDVVFVLDTTSSMEGLIEGAKQKIWSIASRMASGQPTPEIRVGLVAFRDRGDAYVTKRFDLTKDLDAVYGTLQGLRAEGGGDGPEHVGQGLGEAVRFMSWTDDRQAAKLIFLVGDAPAHDDYRDEWNLEAWAKKAVAKGIVVNTVRCGTDEQTAQVFRKVAALADGAFVSLEQSGGMVAAATPFDDELSKLNAELATKTLVAGSRASRASAERKLAGLKALAPSVASDRLSYNAKMAPAAPGASLAGDLGEAVELTAQPKRLEALADDELPEAVRQMDKAQRAAFVAQKAKEKQALEARIVEVARRRDGWLSNNAKKTETSFDDTVMKSVATQAAPAGIAY